jgi:hypothetical protein
MSNPFNIELGPNFPQRDRAAANIELSIFSAVINAEMGLFQKAWSGWPTGEQAPRAGRSDAASQALLDAGMKIAFGDLWRGQQR